MSLTGFENQDATIENLVSTYFWTVLKVYWQIIAVDLKMAVDDLWVEKWIVTKMQNVMWKKSFNTVSTVPSAIRCEASSPVVRLTSFSL